MQGYFLFFVFDSASFFYKYWELASRLRGAVAPPLSVFYSSPFYVIFLAGTQGFLKWNYFNVQFFQIVLGAFNCWMIYRLGVRSFNRTVACLAAPAAIFYGPFILYNATFLPAVWVLAFNLLALNFLLGYFEKGRAPCLAAAGLFIGLSIITRPNFTIFLFLLLVYLLVRRGPPIGRRLKAAAFVLVPAAAVVFPISLFNYSSTKELIPVTASGGWVFYCSNNDRTHGFDFNPPPEYNAYLSAYYARETEPLNYIEHLLSLKLARQRVGRNLTPAEGSRYWLREGLEFIRREPAAYLGLMAGKVAATFNGYEPHDVPEVLLRGNKLRSYPLISLSLALPLALLGLSIARPRAGSAILYLYLASYLISLALLYVIPRFRLPTVPVLLLFAGAALEKLWGELKGKRWGKLSRDLGLLLLFALLVNWKPAAIREDSERLRPAFLREWRGLTYLKEGKPKEAEAAFREALELNPDSYLARYNLESLNNGERLRSSKR